MGKADGPRLTEEEILALLAAKRRAARLQSLQRISTLGSPTTAPGAGAVLANSAAPADTVGDTPRITRGGWFARGQETVQPQHLDPLRHAGSRRTLTYWADAIRHQPWGLWRDRALLLVELAALVALVFVVTGSFSSMGSLNGELADARRAPVAAAAAPPAAVEEEELPGSSSPPPAGSETPGPLRSPVLPGVISPLATPSAQAATRIVIPGIGVDSIVVEGDTWEDLKKGVGHHSGSANAGEKGNAVYSGHDDVYGEVFRRLEELKPGDVVTVYAGIHLYRYEVKRIRIVSPKETSILAATSDATLTLITCYPYRVDTQRLVAVAKLVE
jgi:sortase A